MRRLLWLVVLAGAGALGEAPARERVPVLVVSGANNHDWCFTSTSLARILERAGCFTVDVTRDPATTLADPAALARYAAFVLDYNGPRWGEPAESRFLRAVREGAGVAVVHAADNAFPGWVEYERLVGLLWREGSGHGAFHAFDVTITDRDHPITATLPDLRAHPDELYHGLVRMHGARPRVLATAWSDPATGGSGAHEPMVLVGRYGRGRVFHTPLGHVWPGAEATRASHADPQFGELVARGVEWAATGAVSDGALGGRVTARDDAAWRPLPGPDEPALAHELGEARWRREGGELRADGGRGARVTDEVFGDFVLEVDVRARDAASARVVVRARVDDGRLRGGLRVGAGPPAPGAVDGGRPGRDDESGERGRWRRLRVECVGPSVRAWADGVPIADALGGLAPSGMVGLAVDGPAPVRWSAPRIVELGPAWTWGAQGLSGWRAEGFAAEAPGTAAPGVLCWRAGSDGRLALAGLAGGGSLRLEARGTATLRIAPGGGRPFAVAPGNRPDAWRAVHVHAWGRRLAVLVDGRTLLDDAAALGPSGSPLEILIADDGAADAWLELRGFATLVAP